MFISLSPFPVTTAPVVMTETTTRKGIFALAWTTSRYQIGKPAKLTKQTYKIVGLEWQWWPPLTLLEKFYSLAPSKKGKPQILHRSYANCLLGKHRGMRWLLQDFNHQSEYTAAKQDTNIKLIQHTVAKKGYQDKLNFRCSRTNW